MTPEQREFGSKMFAALASPARLQILERLANGSASVKDIVDSTNLKQSMTSQHLSVLLNAGIVVCTPDGNQHIYSLRGPRIARILKMVEEFHEIHLNNLRAILGQH